MLARVWRNWKLTHWRECEMVQLMEFPQKVEHRRVV